MAKDGKSKATTRLRFPEFDGQPCRDVLLKDVTAECTTRNSDLLPPESVMGVTKAEGIVPMEERLIGKNVSRYKLVEKNWFAYNPMRLNIGSIARWQGDSTILVSPDYVVFRCSEEPESAIDPDFLDHFRRSDQWEDFVTESGIGSVRIRIYYKDIARLLLKLPTLFEQHKIADCLTSLDEVIAAQSRKLDALKAHKKGLMQHLFPREGETLPRLRFPEFRDSNEWTLGKASDIVNVLQGYGFPDRLQGKKEGEFPFYKVSDISTYVDDGKVSLDNANNHIDRDVLAELRAKPIPVGTTVFAKIGEAIRSNKRTITTKLCLVDNNAAGVKRIAGVAHDLFIYYLWCLLPLIEYAGGVVPAVNKSTIEQIPVCYPGLEEQQRIADCLSSLDDQIDAQAQKLNTLKTHKKGLMQQLFPSPAEVEA